MFLKSKTLSDLPEIAQKILQILDQSNTNLLALTGELGAGKTTLVKEIAKELRIKQTVNSPSFVLMNVYKILKNKEQSEKNKVKSKNSSVNLSAIPHPTLHIPYSQLFHFDLYRLSSYKELKDLGFEEIISDKENLVIVEWFDRIEKDFLKRKYLKIAISVDKNERKFKIKAVHSFCAL